MKLFTKMTLTILCPALIGLIILGGVSYRNASSALMEQIENDIPTLLVAQEIGTEMLFRTLRQGMEMPAQNIRILETLRFYANGIKDEQDIADVDSLLAHYIKTTTGIAICGLVAPDGIMLGCRNDSDDAPDKLRDSNVADREYVKAGLAGKASIGTYGSKESGRLSTIVGVPVKDGNDYVGVFFAGLDNAQLSQLLLGRIKAGNKGRAYVYSASGEVILHSDTSQLGRNDAAAEQFKAMQGKEAGRIEFTTADGDAKILYFRLMPSENWYCCIELDETETLARIHTLRTLIIVLAVGLALLVSAIIFVMARGITRPLGVCSRVVEQAARGDLDLSAETSAALDQATRRGDEISVVARGVRHMMDGIRRLLGESEAKTREALKATEEARAATERAEEAARHAELARRDGMQSAANQLTEMVDVISAAATQLSAHISRSDVTASESAQRLSEAATAMNEMNSTVQEVARNASAASEMSAETRHKAEDGAAVVQQALVSIQETQQQTLRLKDDMHQLNEHARSISAIMSVIVDIADQTNLLALNAAIEAARAGEAGRGFAVVADEVRKLAEKTMASTSEVGNAINAIQQSTAKSMDGVDKAVEQIDQATELANKSGKALTEIVSDAETTADEVRAIATASEEQSAASEEINQSIVQVNDMSTETAQAMAQAAQAVNNLSEQARRLEQLINDMKAG